VVVTDNDSRAGYIAGLRQDIERAFRVYEPFLARVNGAGNKQVVFRFANGYGASVVQGPYSFGGDAGLYELGVVRFHGDDWHLTYETPITDDVLGYLAESDVEELLRRISELPSLPKPEVAS
jgi:hypothetical protein